MKDQKSRRVNRTLPMTSIIDSYVKESKAKYEDQISSLKSTIKKKMPQKKHAAENFKPQVENNHEFLADLP